MKTECQQMQELDQGVQGYQGFIPSSQSNIYDIFKPLVKLYGNSYEPLKKAVFYSIIGSVISKNIISCGDIAEDTRINLFVPLKSGYGKREVKEVIKRSIEQINMKYCEPTSLHSEQLIGKTIFHSNGNPIINYGHLADDFLVFEEASSLFSDKNNQETRDYIKIALDPIEHNEIYKKSVDTTRKDAVKYCPHCAMMFFFQPLAMENHIVTTGLLRRGIILTIDPSEDERLQALRQSLGTHDTIQEWSTWIEYLKELRSKTFRWSFNAEISKKLYDLTVSLIQQGNKKGNKAQKYTDIMFFSLRNLLIKISCIQAAINERDELSSEDVERAYNDLSMFWSIQLDFVMNKVKGDIDYMDMRDDLKTCLLILKEKQCFSLEQSQLSIKDYLGKISNRLVCTEDTARHKYYALKDDGYLDSKQIGQHDSKVWLTDTGMKKVDPYITLHTLPTLNREGSMFKKLFKMS